MHYVCSCTQKKEHININDSNKNISNAKSVVKNMMFIRYGINKKKNLQHISWLAAIAKKKIPYNVCNSPYLIFENEKKTNVKTFAMTSCHVSHTNVHYMDFIMQFVLLLKVNFMFF
jgi:hypothetical protein